MIKDLTPLFDGKGKVAKRWTIVSVAVLGVAQTFFEIPEWAFNIIWQVLS